MTWTKLSVLKEILRSNILQNGNQQTNKQKTGYAKGDESTTV